MRPAKPKGFLLSHMRVILLVLALFGALSRWWIIISSTRAHGQQLRVLSNDTCTLLMFRKRLPDEGEPVLATWRSTNLRGWRGVTWREESNGVYYFEKLELGGLQLSGSDIFPLLQEDLTSLVVLNISSKNFTTQFRNTWQICPPLQVMDIRTVSLALCLSHFIASSSMLSSAYLSLSVLNVGRNKFFGEVPDSFFNSGLFAARETHPVRFMNLSSLVLESNNFTGSIPQLLGNCLSLVDLNLAHNYFKGGMPFCELRKLKKLETLDVSNSLATD